jgi:hypothetical protein
MVQNARMPQATRHLQAIPPAATSEEAAAIVAALERFMRATAPPPHDGAPAELDGWHRTALLEGISRDPWEPHLASHWVDQLPPG